jgi:hypothetical protein
VETLLPVAAAAVVVILLVALLIGRRRRGTDHGPVRLGPSWTPPEEDLYDDPEAVAAREAELRMATDATQLDERTVTVTLEAWWEYLSVLRLRPLPRAHDYRFYDPYDPPVAERGPDGPIPDPVRVARDVGQRTDVLELDAAEVLAAVRPEQHDGPDRT